jgi:hypothetical protein
MQEHLLHLGPTSNLSSIFESSSTQTPDGRAEGNNKEDRNELMKVGKKGRRSSRWILALPRNRAEGNTSHIQRHFSFPYAVR